jgi:hypothetical protein
LYQALQTGKQPFGFKVVLWQQPEQKLKLQGRAGPKYLELSFLTASMLFIAMLLSLANLLVHRLLASEPVIPSMYILKQCLGYLNVL